MFVNVLLILYRFILESFEPLFLLLFLLLLIWVPCSFESARSRGWLRDFRYARYLWNVWNAPRRRVWLVRLVQPAHARCCDWMFYVIRFLSVFTRFCQGSFCVFHSVLLEPDLFWCVVTTIYQFRCEACTLRSHYNPRDRNGHVAFNSLRQDSLPFRPHRLSRRKDPLDVDRSSLVSSSKCFRSRIPWPARLSLPCGNQVRFSGRPY